MTTEENPHMTDDTTATSERQVLAPITFSFNPADFLKTMWPDVEQGWHQTADGPEPDEPPEPFWGAKQEVVRLVADLIMKDSSDIREAVRTALIEHAREMVRPIVDEVIANPIQKTDTWGNPMGEPVSIRDLIVKQTNEVLEAKYDAYGKKTAPYDRGTQTYLTMRINEAVKHTLDNELKPVTEKLVADFKARVTSGVSETIGQRIAEVVTRKL